MTETATVNNIDGRTITVGCGGNESCKSCSSSLCNTPDQRVFEVTNTKGLDISVGDTVDVYLAPGKTVAAGFLVLIVPLILFIIGYSVGGRLLPAMSEGVHALFGLVGFAAGFGLSFLYSKKKRTSSLPEVLRVREKNYQEATVDGS